MHRAPLSAPETPDEVLERGPDVSRETEEPMAPYVAGGLPANFAAELVTAQDAVNASQEEGDRIRQLAAELGPPPPLSKGQIARLEALTAQWVRDVRVGGPLPDDTLLYASPAKPPPPPPARSRPALELVPPAADPEEVSERTAELLATETPAPRPTPAPGRDGAAGSARRVSDWVSRHDPHSLAYPVRQRLGRAVPLQDVSLVAGPVLDQGTTPPLTPREASACVGMALACAANVLHARSGLTLLETWQEEDEARELYELAQRRDQRHGEDYAGTSVLGGLLAGRELGLWDEFLWGLGGTKDIAQVLLQLGVAVVVGIPWGPSLETPDAAGVIRPAGELTEGHALAVVGLRIQVAGRPGPWFELQQSRGPAEGVGGRVYLHHRQLAQLLAGVGEAGVPIPRGLA